MKITRVNRFRLVVVPIIIATVALATTAVFVLRQSKVQAATPGWNAGRIIDDTNFTHYTSMSVAQIQSFLNSKVPTCDTNGQRNSEMNNAGVPDYNSNGSIQRWEWGKYKYNQTTFPCLKDYKQNNTSDAQLIYNASRTHRINPKVIIVLLQKEQGLVTDTWPLNIQYRSATGYGCPDTAACDSQYYGLTNQLSWAAKMFRAIMDASPTWYTPYIIGNNYIQYNPNKACGGSNVYIQNRATQALYNYTPYQPNSNALNAPMGQTVSCGSYGNLNFYRYYTSWFGATTGSINQRWSLVTQESYADAGYTQQIPKSLTLEPGEKAYLRVKIKNTGNQVWDSLNLRLGTSKPRNRVSVFNDSSWISSTRPSSPTTRSIAPGEVATFEFSVTAPKSLGTYQEYLTPLIEGYSWLNDIGMYYPITVSSATPYTYVEVREKSLYWNSARTQGIPNAQFSLYAGQRVYGKFTFKNVGNTTLTRSTFKLASTDPRNRASAFQDTDWPSNNRVALLAEASVAPGQWGTILFALKAPSTTGSYNEAFGLLEENVKWLDENKLSLALQVQQRPASELNAGSVMTPGQKIASADGRYTLILQPDGNLVLYSRDRALWHTRTTSTSSNQLATQSDGNLVLYENGVPKWHTHTQSSTPSQLVVQNDGNLVLYSGGLPLWHTHTSGMF